MDFNLEAVEERIRVIEDNLAKLDHLSQMTFEEFMADFRNLDSALHRLQTATEAMIDICAHVVARLRLKVPGNSAELIRALEKADLLSMEHADKYADMIGFRNLLVHRYTDVNEQQVYNALQNDLSDFELFIGDAWQIVRTHNSDTDGNS